MKVTQWCPTLQPQGLYSPRNSPGQKIGVGSLSLLQRILLTQGIKPGSPELQVDSLPTEPSGKPRLGRQVFTDVFKLLEKTLGSPLNCKEIKPVNPKGNQSWIFIGKTDAELEAPLLWPPDAKCWLTGHWDIYDSLEKTLRLGKTEGSWRRLTEDKMFGWHHWLNGYEFEQTLGDGYGQGSLACCGPWGLKVTERLNDSFSFGTSQPLLQGTVSTPFTVPDSHLRLQSDICSVEDLSLVFLSSSTPTYSSYSYFLIVLQTYFFPFITAQPYFKFFFFYIVHQF